MNRRENENIVYSCIMIFIVKVCYKTIDDNVNLICDYQKIFTQKLLFRIVFRVKA